MGLLSPILLTPITARRFNNREVSASAAGVVAWWWVSLLATAAVLPTARSVTAPQDLAALVAVWRGVYSSSGGSADVRAWRPSVDPCNERAPFPLQCIPTMSAQPNQRIISLTLAGQALRGTLSAAVGNLSDLADFTLSNTRVGGTLPQFRSSTLVDLSILNSPVQGTIPSLFATSPSLATLTISGTRVNGSIPEELFSATSTLQSLNLSNNSLAGPLPSSLSGLTLLTTLDLAGNALSGPLPSQLVRSGLSLRLSPGNADLCIPSAAAAAAAAATTPTTTTLLPNTSICPASPPPPAAAPLPPPASTLPPAAVAVIAAGGAALVAVLLGAVLWRVVGKGNGKGTGEEGLIEGAEAVPRAREVADGLTEFQLWELQEATENFHFSRLIGRGGFGHVYRGTLSDGYEVAVKMLHATPGGGQGEAEYRIEIEVIGHVHHRNLVQLVGFCCEGDSRLLAYEFVSGGSLSSRLRDKNNPMTWEHRVRVAVGSAKGLAYLHEQCEPRIIHRDVKPANILLDAAGEAKIADFGLAKVMPQGVNDMTTRVLGTWGYVAPEYVGSERVGVAADVFSFGVVLLELLSGQSPHNTEDLLERAEACLSEGALDSFADLALLASGFDEEQFLRVLRIALLCLEYNPHQRPPMASVVRFLTSPHTPLPDEDSPLEPILEGLGDGHGGGGGGADGGYSESSDTSGGLEDGCMAEEGGGEGGSWLNGGGGEGKEKGDGEDEVALGDGGGGAMGDGVEVVVDDVDDGHEGDARGSHVEGQGTLALNMVVAEAGNLSAAAEGSSGEEFSAMAEGTGDAQVPAEGGEGGTVEAGGSSGGGGGANAEMPGAGLPNPVYVGRHGDFMTQESPWPELVFENSQKPGSACPGPTKGGPPLEQLWQHIKELADSNHAMPVVRAWESNGNTVDMRLATQLIKKLKNHRRPKQAAEVAEWFVQQPGFPRLEADYQLALSAVIRSRNVAAAQALFLAFPQPFRTEKVYQPVFGHVARRGRFMSVESQVDWLRQQGVAEGIPSFNARLQALLAGRRRSGMVAGIAAIMDEMRSKGFTPITITFNIILAGLGRAGQLKEMEYYLGQMENYNLTPDLATMNALISAYVSHGEPEKALEWERRLKTSGAGPDRGTYAAMLKAYGQSGQVDKLEATWSELLASNVPMTRMLHKARIEGYGLAGDVGKAEQAFQELKVQQAPVTETFNSLVFAYAHNHLFPKAKDTILHMDAAGMRPDGITFLHLLRGYLSANQIDNAVTTLHDAVAAGAHRARMKLPFHAFAEVLGGFVEAGEVGKVRELVGLARTMYRTDSNLFNSILTAIVNDWRRRGAGAGVEAGSGEFASEVRGVLEEMNDAGVKANAATEEILHPLGLSNLIDEVGLVRAGGF
ncbi:unnamed protein product [Closterium sp. NIES-64]|nr:unnamed protein product [Closterium sp. NIES-64]